MVDFKGGVDEAIAMLQALNTDERERILADIEKREPEMAALIKENLISFQDLQYITVSMMRTLMRDVKPETLGLALRGVQREISEKLLSMMSKNNRSDIEEVLLGPPQSLNKVQEAQTQIVDVMKKLIDKGELVLDKDSSETMV